MKTILLKALICLILCLALSMGAQAADRWVKVSGGSWDPSPKMLADLKAQIESYVSSQAKIRGQELKSWQEYTFQYQGQEEKGRRYIFINALCAHNEGRGLDKKIIVIFDGGSCFFNLKHNPDRKEFFDLYINGEG